MIKKKLLIFLKKHMEKCIDNSNYISQKEKEIIKESLQNIEIEKIDNHYIRLNSILHQIICKKTRRKKATIVQIKQMKNLPK